IRALDTYCALRHRHSEESAAAGGDDDGVRRALAMLAELPVGRKAALTERNSKRVLSALGFPVTRETAAENEEDAVAAAARLGFPVVSKGEHPDILHKSDLGLVHLNLRNEDELRSACRSAMQCMADAGAA